MDGGANKNNGVFCTNKLAMHRSLPATKQLLLTRYVDTMGHGDTPVPVVGAVLPSAASTEEDDEDEVVVKEE